MKFIRGIIGFAFGILMMCAFALFTTWGFDPASWSSENRGIFAITSIGVGAIISLFMMDP
jgi:hypothetical protein